jgi:hypothetical protein
LLKDQIMSKSVFCTSTFAQAETIVRNLQVAGFSADDISVLVADKEGTRDFALKHNTKAPEGATAGAGTGAVVGGALGWLAGIGTLAIPGVGPLIAAGPIMAALGGAALGGSVGGFTGALIGLGIPEFEARKYEGKVKAGSALISVHSEDSNQTKRAKDIFERAGASDITTAGEAAVPSGRV